jgi:hypothetical protein
MRPASARARRASRPCTVQLKRTIKALGGRRTRLFNCFACISKFKPSFSSQLNLRKRRASSLTRRESAMACFARAPCLKLPLRSARTSGRRVTMTRQENKKLRRAWRASLQGDASHQGSRWGRQGCTRPRVDVSDSPDDRRERDAACKPLGKAQAGVAPAPERPLWGGGKGACLQLRPVGISSQLKQSLR